VGDAASNAPRGGLDEETLAALVARGLSVREIAREVDRSPTTVRHWLARHGLRTSPGERRASRAPLVEGICRVHGPATFVREGRGYLRCRRCRAERVAAWRRRVKAVLIAEAGGRCRLCGYDRCASALEFHHLDPSTKRFGLASCGVARSLERARAEAAKCVLLCSNCHAEVEAGATMLPVEWASAS